MNVRPMEAATERPQPLSRLAQAGSKRRREQLQPESTIAARPPIRIIAETPAAGNELALMLSEIGLPADDGRSEARSDGLTVITGERFAAEFLQTVTTQTTPNRAERTAVFGSAMSTRVQTILHEVGFPAVVYSAPTPPRLLEALATIDPSLMVYRRSTIERREAASAAVQEGSSRLFSHIRSGNLKSAVEEAKQACGHFEALLDSAATAHWISMMQQYHNGTAQHCSLVSAFAMQFARGLGFSVADQRRLFEAAHFHDVGKVEVPLDILDKPGALTSEERQVMERHAVAGYDILSGHIETSGEIAEVARDHHEYLDGSGYYGRVGREISDISRIITICDIFAALLERRSYKPPKTAGQAYAILTSLDGKLDPTLVRAFGLIARSCASD